MALRTRVIEVSYDEPDPKTLREAGDILRAGGLVAFATETVYGLGADATNPAAVLRIFGAKGRPANNPLIVHADNGTRARACVSVWPRAADILEQRFWPGPLSLVLPRSSSIPDIVTAGNLTVGVRIPAAPIAHALIAAADRPIAAPSANRSTGISPTEAAHVLNDLDGKIDLVLDSGPTRVGIESTVIDLSSSTPRVLRPGRITIEELSTALGTEVLGPDHRVDESGALSSPGQLSVHYAPRTPTFRVRAAALNDLPASGMWGLIEVGTTLTLPRGVEPSIRATLDTPAEAEANLYAWLHMMDAASLSYLIVASPPDEPRWLAIRDRIQRASRPCAHED